MSDGTIFRDYVCNACLPSVAMFHAQLASRNSHPFCSSLVEFHNGRGRHSNGRGRGFFRGNRGNYRGSRGGNHGNRGSNVNRAVRH